MAQITVYDTQGKSWLIDESKVEEAKSFGWSVQPSTNTAAPPSTVKIPVIDTQGKYWEVPENNVPQATQQGWRRASPEEVRDYTYAQEKQDIFGSPQAQAVAGIAGGLRGVSLGTSDIALRAAGVEPETIQSVKETNPIASGVGEAVGVIAPAVLSGGAATGPGLANLAGRGATRMAAERGAGALASRAIGGAVEGAIFGGGQAISELAATPENELSLTKAADQLTTNLTLGAAFGGAIPVVGAAAKKTFQGLRRASGELYAMGSSLVNPSLSRNNLSALVHPGEEGRLARSLYVDRESGVQEYANAVYNKLQEVQTGVRAMVEDIVETTPGLRKELNNLLKLDSLSESEFQRLTKVFNETLDNVVFDPATILPTQMPGLIRSIPWSEADKPLLNKVLSSVESYSDDLSNTLLDNPTSSIRKLVKVVKRGRANLDDLIKHSGIRDLLEIRNILKRPFSVESLSKLLGKNAKPNDAAKLYEAIQLAETKLTPELATGNLEEIYKQIFKVENKYRKTFFEYTQELKNRFPDNPVVSEVLNSGVFGEAGRLENLWRGVFQPLREESTHLKTFLGIPAEQPISKAAVELYLKKIANQTTDISTEFSPSLFQQYANSIPLLIENYEREIAPSLISKQAAKELGVLGGTNIKAVTELAGKKPVSTQELVGAIGGGILFGAPVVASSQQVLRRPELVVNFLHALDKVQKTGASNWAKSAAEFLSGPAVKNPVLLGLLKTTKVVQEPGKKEDKYQAFNRISNDLEQLQRGLVEEKLENLFKGLDQASPELSSIMKKRVRGWVDYLVDKMPKPASPTIAYQWRPSDTQLVSFARRIAAINNPTSVLNDLMHGINNTEGVEVLNTFYPDMLAATKNSLLENMDKISNLPYQMRLKLSLLFQIPLDDSLAKIASLQTKEEKSPSPTGRNFDFAGMTETKTGRISKL